MYLILNLTLKYSLLVFAGNPSSFKSLTMKEERTCPLNSSHGITEGLKGSETMRELGLTLMLVWLMICW